MSSMMVLTYALLFLFDLVLLVLVLLAFVEKRKVRKEVSALLDSESSILELSESMERLIEEYRSVASRIQDDTSAKRDELMRTIQRADRLLMELVSRSDRFELALESREASRQPAAEVTGKRPGDVPRTAHSPLGGAAGPKPAPSGQPPTKSVRPATTHAGISTEQAGVQRKPARPPRPRLEKPARAMPSGPPSESKRAHKEVSSDLAGKRMGARTMRPFVAPADIKKQAASPSEEDEMEKTKRLVIDLSRQGLDIETIAKSLRVPIGQVKLILDVQKSKQS